MLTEYLDQASDCIGHPGKFEGEPIETAYFYLVSLDGDGEMLSDSDTGEGWSALFELDDEERETFEFGPAVTHFFLAEDSQGFVTGFPLTEAEADKERGRV